MSTLLTHSTNMQLDELLEQVCVALQITSSQYQNAEEKYRAVGRWLRAPESPLAKLNPEIYPQGSFALQTTTRAWTDEDEYDLDLVLQVKPTSDNPMTLYRLVERRLLEHSHYREILESKRRCLCLNYTGDDGAFHMDILPARQDALRGGTCIEIPDRNTPTEWQPSNPLGYQAWFESRARLWALERAKQEPLPGNPPADERPVLNRTVQLMKRRRDLMLHDREEYAPRSVLVTTLAGKYYRGEQDVITALMRVLAGVNSAIEAARPGRIIVCNPANEEERFCESFKTDEHYRVFTDYIAQFQREVAALASITSLTNLEPALSAMFGSKVTKRALLEYGERVSTARRDGRLYADAARRSPGLMIGTSAGISASKDPIPNNTFYGQ